MTTIGRDPANGIFLNDMTVSRSHARIIREGLGARIEDLGSLNGTWVDGAIVNAAPLTTVLPSRSVRLRSSTTRARRSASKPVSRAWPNATI